MIPRITLFFLALSSAAPQAWAGPKFPSLSQEGFQQLTELADGLAKRCPPPDCLPVFIGRSSTLVSAYWEARGGPRSITLPASGLAGLPESRWGEVEARFRQEVLTQLLDPESSAVREILVIDYVNGGQSLALTASWIAQHQKSRTLHARITAAAYGNALSAGARALLDRGGVNLEILPFALGQRSGDLAFLVRQKMVENYSEIDGFHLDRTSATLPRPDRSLRRPYPYKDGFSHYASYQDVVEWLKNPELRASLPTAFQLQCQAHLSSPPSTKGGANFWN